MDSREVVTLRDHLETRCDERMRLHDAGLKHLLEKLENLDKFVAAKFTWLERSTLTTASVMEKRLEGMNEFRDALKDLTARLATRDELEEVRKQLTHSFSRTEHEAFMKTVEADMRVLRESKAKLEGMATQTSVIITFVLASVGAITGLAVLVREMMR